MRISSCLLLSFRRSVRFNLYNTNIKKWNKTFFKVKYTSVRFYYVTERKTNTNVGFYRFYFFNSSTTRWRIVSYLSTNAYVKFLNRIPSIEAFKPSRFPQRNHPTTRIRVAKELGFSPSVTTTTTPIRTVLERSNLGWRRIKISMEKTKKLHFKVHPDSRTAKCPFQFTDFSSSKNQQTNQHNQIFRRKINFGHTKKKKPNHTFSFNASHFSRKLTAFLECQGTVGDSRIFL